MLDVCFGDKVMCRPYRVFPYRYQPGVIMSGYLSYNIFSPIRLLFLLTEAGVMRMYR